jgi:hypothetical protein
MNWTTAWFPPAEHRFNARAANSSSPQSLRLFPDPHRLRRRPRPRRPRFLEGPSSSRSALLDRRRGQSPTSPAPRHRPLGPSAPRRFTSGTYLFPQPLVRLRRRPSCLAARRQFRPARRLRITRFTPRSSAKAHFPRRPEQTPMGRVPRRKDCRTALRTLRSGLRPSLRARRR